jgi:hypothetical protein
MLIGAILQYHCPEPCGAIFDRYTERDPDTGDWLASPCPACGSFTQPGIRRTRNAVIPPAERTVYFEGPDGKIRFPSRNDQPMHPKLASMGYERRECLSIADVRVLERRSQRISEKLNYDDGSGTPRPDGVGV